MKSGNPNEDLDEAIKGAGLYVKALVYMRKGKHFATISHMLF